MARIAEIKVIYLFYSHPRVQRCSDHVDSFCHLGLPVSDNLRAKETSAPPSSRNAHAQFAGARIVSFVVPNLHFRGEGIETGIPRLRFA
jgi:hypothetical protein